MNYFPLFYLSYFCHSAEGGGGLINGELLSLNFEINSYICNILYLYLDFTLCLCVIHLVIKKGDKLNKSYPLVYKFIVIGLFSCLLIIAIFFLYNLHGLLNEIIGFVVKMISFYSRASGPSSTGGPGGFGQPSGGGGRPPNNPGGFPPGKGHYNEDLDEDSDDTNKNKNKKRTQKQKDEHAAHMKDKRAQDGPGKRKDEYKRRYDNMTREEKDKRKEKSQNSRDNVNFLS